MFNKLFINCLTGSAILCGSLEAVTLNVGVILNSSTGFITNTPTPVLATTVLPSGRAFVVSVTNAITDFTRFTNLLSTTTSTSANFDLALTQTISSTNPTLEAATNPGLVRSFSFTNGALSSVGNSTQLGNATNRTYFFIVAENNGIVTGIGAYTGNNVPSTGAMTYNAATVGDGPGIGTSVLVAATGTGPTATIASGFQLMNAIPETSTSLLGAIGALALLRRRRN